MECNGIVNIDKPEGITSHTAVSKVRRFLNTKKVGHSGTLDPMATGVLPIMIGSAVKASEWLVGHDKRYIAGIKLGIETDSEDTSGSITSSFSGTLPDFEEFRAVAESFTGRIMQTPPMYSAIKKDGQKLVDLARKGIVVERSPRQTEIYSINAFIEKSGLFLEVFCSKGTYIRTLCADIGKRLGCGAAMSSLRRTQAGFFHISDSIGLDDFLQTSSDKVLSLIKPVEGVFYSYSIITLPPFFERLFRNGAPIFLHKIGQGAEEGVLYRIYGAEGFFAVGEVKIIDGKKAVKVKKFF